MKAFVKFRTKGEYGDWQEGDEGVVDGYVTVDGKPYAVVIDKRTNRFVLAEPYRLEFIEYRQDEEITEE